MALSDNKVYKNAVKNGDLSIEQITDIQKKLITSLRSRETFWDKFCSHTAVGDGHTAYEWRKLNIPELKLSDISNLSEGITPAGLKLEYVKFSVSPVDFGSWIGYTDQSKKYNFDDVVADAKTVLGQRAFEELEIRKAQFFMNGCVTMDLVANSNGKTDGFLKSLLKARTILKKNHVKPLRGNRYGCILTPEQAAQVLLDYETQITHTSEKEAIINGYIGELGGFILFENADAVMYHDYYFKTSDVALDSVKTYYTVSNNVYTAVAEPAVANIGSYYEKGLKGYCLFIGKTEYGMPVQTVAFGNDSVQVFNNELGKAVSTDANGNVVADTLHQHGSVSYKVMGFAARIIADEALIRAEFVLEGGEDRIDVADASRSHFDAIAGVQASPAD